MANNGAVSGYLRVSTYRNAGAQLNVTWRGSDDVGDVLPANSTAWRQLRMISGVKAGWWLTSAAFTYRLDGDDVTFRASTMAGDWP